MQTTCQICGREIKAKTGVIAHHGYTRPQLGSEWQTSSCFGARWRPYEVACDALPVAINKAEAILRNVQTRIAELKENSPETLMVLVDAWRSTRQSITVTRPESFSSREHPGATRPRSYENEYWRIKFQLDFTERNISDSLKYMRQRLTDWKAPA